MVQTEQNITVRMAGWMLDGHLGCFLLLDLLCDARKRCIRVLHLIHTHPHTSRSVQEQALCASFNQRERAIDRQNITMNRSVNQSYSLHHIVERCSGGQEHRALRLPESIEHMQQNQSETGSAEQNEAAQRDSKRQCLKYETTQQADPPAPAPGCLRSPVCAIPC